MIAKAFKTIDLSEQVARQNRESNQANVDGIKNFAESFVTNRQGSINEARQLMSDYDAVINEVDDMHKENVANEIATAQSELAKNIYKSKWNGTRLNLKELNSDGFNYARDMRKLKNLELVARFLSLRISLA